MITERTTNTNNIFLFSFFFFIFYNISKFNKMTKDKEMKIKRFVLVFEDKKHDYQKD